MLPPLSSNALVVLLLPLLPTSSSSLSPGNESTVTVILAETTESGESAVANIEIVPAHDHLSLQPSEAEKSVIGGLNYISAPSAQALSSSPPSSSSSYYSSAHDSWKSSIDKKEFQSWASGNDIQDSVVNAAEEVSYYNAPSSYDPNFTGVKPREQQRYTHNYYHTPQHTFPGWKQQQEPKPYSPGYTDQDVFLDYRASYKGQPVYPSLPPPPPPKPPIRPVSNRLERNDLESDLDDLTPSFSGFMGFLKEKALSPFKYLYQAATGKSDTASTSPRTKDTISEKSDSDSQPPGLAERILEGDFELRELLPPFEDPAANLILGLTTLALITQGIAAPFGSVVVANPGGTGPGSRQQRNRW